MDQASQSIDSAVLNADKAKHVYAIKRGQGKGYSGIVNPLYYEDNCNMVYGDAAAVLAEMTEAVRGLTKAAA
jgi:NAD(P) transhydrogenase subunit beta